MNRSSASVRLAILWGTTFCLLAISPGIAWAGLEETFARANESFWSGEFETAVGGYEELVELGVRDADVYFNLGTAHARTGRLGAAILNLERALRLDPGHAEARENLTLCRTALARRRTANGQSADLDPPRSLWASMLERLSPTQLALPFVLLWITLFALLVWRRVATGDMLRLVLAIAAPLIGALALTSGGLLLGKASYVASMREAIVVTQGSVDVREGPSERFPVVFDADEGELVQVLDREGSWLHLREASGREGWAERSDVGELRQE